MFELIEYSGAARFPMRAGRLRVPDDRGDNRAMLFIPGLGGSVKGALDFLEQLQPAYPTIYGPDLRGFGLNPLETPLTGADLLLPDLEAFYQQVILPAGHQELVLCGISLGGVLATLLAARHPERFSKVILMAPAYKPHPKTFTLSYTLINTLAFLLKGKKALTQLPYGMDALTTNPAVLNDTQYLHMEPLILNAGFLLGVRDLCQKAFSEIRQLRLPTMMVIPGQDVVCDPAAMRAAFARIPEQTANVCQEYPDFYHDVLFEAEHPRIAEALLQWVDQSVSLASSLSSI